jgi:hypothetical protein
MLTSGRWRMSWWGVSWEQRGEGGGGVGRGHGWEEGLR